MTADNGKRAVDFKYFALIYGRYRIKKEQPGSRRKRLARVVRTKKEGRKEAN